MGNRGGVDFRRSSCRRRPVKHSKARRGRALVRNPLFSLRNGGAVSDRLKLHTSACLRPHCEYQQLQALAVLISEQTTNLSQPQRERSARAVLADGRTVARTARIATWAAVSRGASGRLMQTKAMVWKRGERGQRGCKTAHDVPRACIDRSNTGQVAATRAARRARGMVIRHTICWPCT